MFIAEFDPACFRGLFHTQTLAILKFDHETLMSSSHKKNFYGQFY
ncbi:hypothetical protein AVDCRST_MAG84-2465 [uncultured Microcoleus sp.]|uniref:Uncharacterized protein n=1 Tax=uncultured Microcoleus sp. TaxID=259945 RepID=A0A6J4LXS3_9CYAN|nr:hypothetical protein AVDCRST_MAG84-2465 [uncultured Microcoleus sp.]